MRYDTYKKAHDCIGPHYQESGVRRHSPACAYVQTGPEVIKLFSMLNSTEHEISTAHKNLNAEK